MTAISISGLVKTFGHAGRWTGSTSRWPPARCTASSAPTASGKSTTIRVLLGLLRADAGESRLLGGDPWRDAVDAAPPAGLRARRRQPVAQPHRRRGHRPAGPAARRARPRAGATSCSSASTSTPQEGAHLLQGQPAEGRARRRAGLRRRAAPARRAHLGPRPADGGGVPGHASRRSTGDGPDGAAVQPHPGRGRGAVRPGEHHPCRPHRRERHAGRAAPPHPYVHLGGDRARRSPASTDLPGVHDLVARRPPRPLRRRHRPPRRRDAPPGHLGRPQPDQPAADAGGAVPAPLRRRARASGRRASRAPSAAGHGRRADAASDGADQGPAAARARRR